MYAPTLSERVHGSAALRRRQAVGRGLAHVLGRLELHGTRRVPRTGPVLLAVNHRDFLDGPLLFGLVPRPVSFLVKADAFTPAMTPLLRGSGQIPVQRPRPDPAAVRVALRILRAGGVVGVFPEGSRGDGLARSAKPGVGYLALRSGAAVVPVACHGTDALARGLRRPRVQITFGRPVAVERVPDAHRLSRRAVAAQAERLRAALADLVTATGETA